MASRLVHPQADYVGSPTATLWWPSGIRVFPFGTGFILGRNGDRDDPEVFVQVCDSLSEAVEAANEWAERLHQQAAETGTAIDTEGE